MDSVVKVHLEFWKKLTLNMQTTITFEKIIELLLESDVEIFLDQ